MLIGVTVATGTLLRCDRFDDDEFRNGLGDLAAFKADGDDITFAFGV